MLFPRLHPDMTEELCSQQSMVNRASSMIYWCQLLVTQGKIVFKPEKHFGVSKASLSYCVEILQYFFNDTADVTLLLNGQVSPCNHQRCCHGEDMVKWWRFRVSGTPRTSSKGAVKRNGFYNKWRRFSWLLRFDLELEGWNPRVASNGTVWGPYGEIHSTKA